MPRLKPSTLGATDIGRTLQRPARVNFSDSPYSRYGNLIQSQRPALYWPFDETEIGTTAFDASGNARNGTHSNGLATNSPPLIRAEDDRFARSAFYLASGSYRTSSTYAAFTPGSVRTFTGWAQHQVALATKCLFGSDAATNQCLFRTNNSASGWQWQMNNTTSTSASALWVPVPFVALGETYHWALIVDDGANTAELYINGISLGSQALANSTDWHASAGNFKVGAYATGTFPFDGYIDDVAVFERALTRDEIQKQYVTGSTVTLGDGGQATEPLSTEPPDYSGYTLRIITEAESAFMRGVYEITLDDGTDYLIHAPRVIRRALRIVGGRNVVILGMHIQIDYQGLFPNGDFLTGLNLVDGASSVDRIIHIEGLKIDGEDLGEGLDLSCPTAQVYVGYWYQQVANGRSSDQINTDPTPAFSSFGTNAYAARHWVHSDLLQAISTFRRLKVERATLFNAGTGIHLGAEIADDPNVVLKHINVRATPKRITEEAPVTHNSPSFALGAARYTWNAGVESWAATGGSTVTHNTSTPINGAGSLQISKNSTDKQSWAFISFGSAQNWSANGTAIRLKARLDSGGGSYPMIRVDISDNANAGTTSEFGWFNGEPQKLQNGVTVETVSNYPTAVLQAVRRARIVIMKDGTSDTFTVNVDDFDHGTGEMTATFTPDNAYNREGSWAYFKNFDGSVNMTDCWADVRSFNGFKDGVSYEFRYWDGGAYVDDMPPGGATIDDAVFPTPETISSDGTGTYVQWDHDNGIFDHDDPNLGAKVYEGAPPTGDFCPPHIAGVNYHSPSTYLADTFFYALTPATTTATAQALDYEIASGHSVTLTPATETDTAQAITKFQRVTLTSATESDVAQGLDADQRLTLTSATETDTAQALTKFQRVTLTTATETDTTQAVTKFQRVSLTHATETDVAQGLDADQRLTLTSATETDAAQALTKFQRVTLTFAAETDSAQAITFDQAGSVSLTPAAETDTAQTLTARTLVSIASVAELDAAQALSLFFGEPPPVTGTPLGGVFDETSTGGLVTEPSRSGTPVAKVRGGTVNEPSRNGLVDEPSRSGEVIEVLGGDFDQFANGGTVTEPSRNGVVVAKVRGGLILVGIRGGVFDETATGGDVDEPSRNGSVDEPSRNGVHDESLTNGVVA